MGLRVAKKRRKWAPFESTCSTAARRAVSEKVGSVDRHLAVRKVQREESITVTNTNSYSSLPVSCLLLVALPTGFCS